MVKASLCFRKIGGTHFGKAMVHQNDGFDNNPDFILVFDFFFLFWFGFERFRVMWGPPGPTTT